MTSTISSIFSSFTPSNVARTAKTVAYSAVATIALSVISGAQAQDPNNEYLDDFNFADSKRTGPSLVMFIGVLLLIGAIGAAKLANSREQDKGAAPAPAPARRARLNEAQRLALQNAAFEDSYYRVK